jgi:hypothetical protein
VRRELHRAPRRPGGHALSAERDRQLESAGAPNDYGIPLDAEHWDERTVRNVKMSWADQEDEKLPVGKGLQFYCLTPKSRHSVHSSWANVDWHLIWNSNFGDPYRIDKRCRTWASTRFT